LISKKEGAEYATVALENKRDQQTLTSFSILIVFND
jgi:hypothetical protein